MTPPPVPKYRSRCEEHIWTTEQQTKHRVCAWCGACEDPDCTIKTWWPRLEA